MITTEMVLTELRAVVEEFGEDYVYIRPGVGSPHESPACRYSHGDKPGCIVGQVLHRLGYSLDLLAQFDRSAADLSAGGTEVRAQYRRGQLGDIDPLAVSVLSAAQSSQDTGRSWGVALRAAEKVAARELETV